MIFSLPALIAAAALAIPVSNPLPAAPSSEPPPIASVRCTAPMPAAGAAFEGPVLHVFDGANLCVALGPIPSQWVRVELDDAPAAGGRQAMMAAVFAKRVVCVAGPSGEQGVIARCRLDGQSLGEVAGRPDVLAVATSWR